MLALRLLLIPVVSASLLACSSAASRSHVKTTLALRIDDIGALDKLGRRPTPAEYPTIEADIDALIGYCTPILSGLEEKAATRAKWAFALSMSALLAGSVVAPALVAASATGNASWIAALSGFAGATNFAGEALRSSGLSGTANAADRNAIIGRVRTHLEVALDPSKTLTEIRSHLIAAKAECAIYLISEPTIPSPPKS